MLQLPVYVLRYSLITIKATLKYLTRQEEISLKAVKKKKKREKKKQTKKTCQDLPLTDFPMDKLTIVKKSLFISP